jgi:hypothetical protein
MMNDDRGGDHHVVTFPLGRAAWLFRPVLTRPDVHRVSLSWFVQFGAALQPATRFPSDIKAAEGHASLLTLKPYLDALIQSASAQSFIPLYLRSSLASVRELHNLIVTVLTADDSNVAFDQEKHNIWMKAFDVERLLNAELSIQPTYMVFPKRGYDIEVLISDGMQLFSEDCKRNFSDEEKYDINQSAKCLAFEVPTAAAFHVFRAVESVIRRYYEVVIGKLPAKRMRNWGAYIKQLRSCGADIKVLSVLEQMRDLYRNPILHPETQLTMDEALSLIGIAETAISTMVADLRKRKTEVLATFRRKKPFSDDRATNLGARTRRQVAADKL